MRVEAVEAYPISVKAGERLTGGTFSYSHYQTVLVKAVCDGVEGWGEAMTRAEPKATALLVKQMARGLLGRRVRGPHEVWNELWQGLRVRGHTRGTDVEALSGLEMALWDSYARVQGKPLNRLLAKSPAETVGAYAGSLFASRGPLRSQVEAAKAAELAGAKVKVGFGPRADQKLLRKVRRLWEDGLLVADANGAYQLRAAALACSLFAEFDLAWFEEPLPADDWDGYAELGRKSEVRLGAGEAWFAGDFEEVVDRKLVGVLEPSVSRCGGVGTGLRVGSLAARRGLGFSPMTGMNSGVSLAASIHVASAVPSIGVEYNPFANPLQNDLTEGLVEPRAGRMAVPRGHGLGIEIDMGFVRRNKQ